MAEDQLTRVIIDGREIQMSGSEDKAYMEQIAAYINGKIEELKNKGNYNRQTGEDKRLMLLLNIADDYYRAKQQAEEAEERLAGMEDEMENLRRELVKAQLRRDQPV